MKIDFWSLKKNFMKNMVRNCTNFVKDIIFDVKVIII